MIYCPKWSVASCARRDNFPGVSPARRSAFFLRTEKKGELFMSENGIRDARSLGAPKMFVLGLQHMFAMFGATVLVPIITGLNVSVTLLFAGLGTLLFHLLTRGKVPAFLGSSFAFMGGYAMVRDYVNGAGVENWIPYAGVGVACAGLLYVLLAILFKAFGARRVMRFFPPIVTGPIIICIGITLSNSAINNCAANWWIALVAIAVVIICNIWGKGMLKIVPILMGVLVSYVVAALCGQVDFTEFHQAAWIGLPVRGSETVFSLFNGGDASLIISSLAFMVPIALATMVEHIGDHLRHFFHRGAELRGRSRPAPHAAGRAAWPPPWRRCSARRANTTYGENTGVLALTRVYDPRVIRIAAVLAVVFSFSPKFAALIHCMPTATIGGVSLILYGMISAIGVRNVVENQVDFTRSRNVIIAALIISLALGIHFSGALGCDTVNSTNGALSFTIGDISIKLSGLAVAAIVGIALNALLPGNDYEFGKSELGDTSVNFKV